MFQAPPVLIAKRTDSETGEAVTLWTEFTGIVFESMKTYEDEGVEGMMVRRSIPQTNLAYIGHLYYRSFKAKSLFLSLDLSCTHLIFAEKF